LDTLVKLPYDTPSDVHAARVPFTLAGSVRRVPPTSGPRAGITGM